jgi:hypothetical protein
MDPIEVGAQSTFQTPAHPCSRFATANHDDVTAVHKGLGKAKLRHGNSPLYQLLWTHGIDAGLPDDSGVITKS